MCHQAVAQYPLSIDGHKDTLWEAPEGTPIVPLLFPSANQYLITSMLSTGTSRLSGEEKQTPSPPKQPPPEAMARALKINQPLLATMFSIFRNIRFFGAFCGMLHVGNQRTNCQNSAMRSRKQRKCKKSDFPCQTPKTLTRAETRRNQRVVSRFRQLSCVR